MHLPAVGLAVLFAGEVLHDLDGEVGEHTLREPLGCEVLERQL